MVKIAPSILAADFEHLEEEVKSVEQAGADYIHVDVMDGKFVPNQTPGLEMLKRSKSATSLILDTHLMVENPEEWIEDFLETDILTFHIEAVPKEKIVEIVQKIHQKGVRVGLAIKPQTPIEELFPYISMIDMVLVMTVEPGYGGQKLIKSCLKKIAKLRHYNEEITIEVDGGVNLKNIAKIKQVGANVIVAGTAIFGAKDRANIIHKMKK